MHSITPTDLTGKAAPMPQTSAVEAVPVKAPEAVEAAPAETKPAHDPMAAKYAALAKHQKALRQQQVEIQEQRRAIEQERQLIEQAKTFKQRLTQDPYGVMLEQGLTADQVAALMLQQPNPEDQKYSLLQQEMKAIKDAQEQARTEMQRVQEQQYEDAKKQIRNDVERLVSANDSFETIQTMGATEAVVALIEETFNSEGRLMDLEEAAREVEDYLVEEAMKIAQLKKIRAKFNPAPDPQQVPQKTLTQQTPLQTQQQLKTLSNRITETTARPMTQRERRERAILAFQGKLT